MRPRIVAIVALVIVGITGMAKAQETPPPQGSSVYPIPYVDADPNVPDVKPEKMGNYVRTNTSITWEASLSHACGEAHHDTPCDKACVQWVVTFSNKPSCGKICLDLPADKKPSGVTLWARNLDQNFWSPCGPDRQPGDCDIGWTRYEKTEYYADRDRICVIVKNWSHNLERGYKVRVDLIPKNPPPPAVAAAPQVQSEPQPEARPKRAKKTRKRMTKDWHAFSEFSRPTDVSLS